MPLSLSLSPWPWQVQGHFKKRMKEGKTDRILKNPLGIDLPPDLLYI